MSLELDRSGDDQRPTEGDSRQRGMQELLQLLQATDAQAPRS